MKQQCNGNICGGLLALALLALAGSGCVSREMAARMIVEAPNKHYSPAPPAKLAAFWDHFTDGSRGSPFVYMKVRTGPPVAELAMAELPPGDYHVRFITRVRTNLRDGKKFLTMKFQSQTNENYKPLKESATIVVLHGYMMYKETMAPWASVLAQAGYRVVLVDLRGHGESTGDEVSYGKYETADLMRMLDYLKAQGLCDEKVGVLGLSYGATIALHWAAVDPRVQAVVAIAPYNHPEEAAARLAKELKVPVSPGTLREALALAAKRMDLKWSDWSGEAAIRKIKEPVLLISGGHDRICVAADTETLRKAAPAGTKVLTVPGVNHFVLGFLLHDLAEPVKAWFTDHLEPTPEAPAHIVMGKKDANRKLN
jgi:pimeloyl-ACP methyl ester carboxylesterase